MTTTLIILTPSCPTHNILPENSEASVEKVNVSHDNPIQGDIVNVTIALIALENVSLCCQDIYYREMEYLSKIIDTGKGLKEKIRILVRMMQVKAYLFWVNPDAKYEETRKRYIRR